MVVNSVVDPDTLNLDPDPGFWPNMDPDPGQDTNPGLCCHFEEKKENNFLYKSKFLKQNVI